MRTEPRFVTPADFFNYWGVDLNFLLKNQANISNKANIFLMLVEDRLMNWIDTNTFRNVKWEDLTPFQLENLQLAILTQAMYVYRNSDISLDSGYDPEKGIIAPKEQLNKIVICEAAIDFLRSAGLFNLTISNKRRRTRFLV